MNNPDYILGIDVIYLHTPHPALADWYHMVLGLPKGYGDGHWQEFSLQNGSRFAMDFTSFPRSVVEKQSIMISYRVADIEEAVRVFIERGVKFFNSPDNIIFDVGPSLVATFQDPDGNWLQLSSEGLIISKQTDCSFNRVTVSK